MARKKEWREGEMILTFKLNKIIEHQTATMQEWLSVVEPNFNAVEQGIFESLLHKALKVSVWSEENLKMKFISPILELGQVLDSDNFVSFFDKSLESEVQGYKLSVKVDFTIGSGLLDYMETPYFHFQEYKPQKNPTGDPMAQLLEAFLIAQEKNKASGKIVPLYGCEIIGKNWTFITMEAHEYCVSKSFDSTDKEDLLKIIAILRKFREILETKLLVS
jgi:hypothetical protein